MICRVMTLPKQKENIFFRFYCDSSSFLTYSLRVTEMEHCKMDKIAILDVICYLYFKKMNTTEILVNMQETLNVHIIFENAEL